MRLFIAQTLDGFIAGPGDSLDHLTPFHGNDYGYDAFVATCDAVALGRTTFDRIFPTYGWTYPTGLTGRVITRRPLPEGLPDNVRAASSVAEAASAGTAVFLDGGASVIRQALDQGLVQEAQIFTLPIRIGAGTRLFSDGAPVAERWTLLEARSFPCGTTGASYRIGGAPLSAGPSSPGEHSERKGTQP